MFQSLQGRGHFYNQDYLMWKPMQKQRTLREHGIAWVEYITNPRSRIQVGKGIPTNSIILSILFDKAFSNIVVCASFDTNNYKCSRKVT